MPPKVSVIIRAYNPNEWIFEALESVFNQDYDGVIEIVLCYDSGSVTDDILEKLKAIKGFSNRVFKLIVHEHASPTRALFEHGFKEFSGDYVTILDYDNLYPRDYICRVMEKIGGRDFVFTNPMLMNASGRVLGVRAHKDAPKKVGFEALTAYN
ncbi:MAG TPA: glycosyltransferase family 2 protein, partial [Ignisphaera sp.]|nr:glycosyltransferase family 2 protein [Ignisphaera sp.]